MAEKKRYSEDQLLAMGKPGNAAVLGRYAFALGKRNNFTGTKLAGKTDAGASSMWYARIRTKSGPLFKLPLDSDSMKNVISTGRAAKGDISDEKYTDSVKKFINAIMNLSMGGGTRARDFSSVKAVEL